MNAYGGIAPNILITGCKILSKTCSFAIMYPTITPITLPIKNPLTILSRLTPIWTNNVPSSKNFLNVTRTSVGAGRNALFIHPIFALSIAYICHITKNIINEIPLMTLYLFFL